MLKVFPVWMVITVLFWPGDCVAAEAPRLDRKHPNYVRAVLINKITPFVYWRTSAFSAMDDPIKICLIENGKSDAEDMTPYLKLLKDRKYGQRSYQTVLVDGLEQKTDGLPPDCHIYYLGNVSDSLMLNLVEKAMAEQVLTIADDMDELSRGAMIAFIEQRGKMKIYVNTEALDKSKIKIKSSLMRIAKKI